MKKLYFILSLAFLSITSFAKEIILKDAAASKKINGANLLRYTDESALPNYIQFYSSSAPNASGLRDWMQTFYHFPSNVNLSEINKTSDELGMVHIRYRQTLNGIPVQGTMYNVHTKAGKIVSMGGVIYDDISSANLNTSITESVALQHALSKVNATIYKWQLPEEEARLKVEQNNPVATYYPVGSTCILKVDGIYHLCYSFNIYAHTPMGRTMEYVDANSGNVIFSKNLIEHINTNGTAVTKFSGTKPFQTDSTSPTNFRLRDNSRGLGVQTYDMNTGTNYGSSVDFIDADNYWNNVNATVDEAATDAHWGAQKTYDYFYTKYGRNSIDDAGYALNSYVHYDVAYVNAFWDGTRMTYGDGDISSGFFVMTALDVCGHEITHGLTNFTADLSGTTSGTAEADALNEGYSDIFGTSTEKYARPTQWDWVIGGDITCTSSGVPDGVGIRNMANPATLGQPICYQGTNWSTFGEPHDNDGPLIYWFYLLSTGSTPNNITALGVDTSALIAFRTLTVHLFPGANYADARFYSILSSTELYGGCSTPTISTTNAWHTVCVGAAYVPGPTTADFAANILTSCDTSLSVDFTNNSMNGNTFSWDFGDGVLSTAFNPSHTYSSGIYTVKLYVDGGTCGLDTMIQTAYIHVGPPAGPATTGATLCSSGSATITATPNNIGDTIRWYTTSVGGSSIATGNSYTTPVLTSTTTYYAEETVSGPTFHVGPLNNTSVGASSTYNTSRYQIFDCSAPCTLVSVWVQATGAGNRTIVLKDASGTTLQTVVVNIPAGGSVVNLNMPIPIGTGLQLGATGTSINMYRNSAGASYPYTNGPISITGNSAGDPVRYYFFYDWVVKSEDCISVRTPATVNVGSGTTPASITPAAGLSACIPNTVLLNANTGTGLSYQWYNGTTPISGATNPSYSASASGSYSVMVSSVSGCPPGTSTPAVVSISAAPTSTITALGSTTFCVGGTVILSANTGTGYTYQWYFNGNPIAGATNAVYNANATGGYSVQVTNTTGCATTSSTTNITASPAPNATITPASTAAFCPGGNVTLTANTGASTYQWYLNGSPISGATNSTISVNTVGNYTVEETNAAGCSGLSTITMVTAATTPSASITASGSTTICQGSTVMLNATIGTSFTYQWYLGGTPITGATNASYAATQGGAYTVLVTNASGCGATSSATTVIVNPAPVPVIVNTGGVLSVSGGPFSSYQWYLNGNPIAGATNSTYTVTQNGVYTVMVKQNVCEGLSAAVTLTGVWVNDINTTQIQISPNPTTDIIHIEGLVPYHTTVLNVHGQILKDVYNKTDISLSNIANGLYFVQLYNEEGKLIFKQKIMKK